MLVVEFPNPSEKYATVKLEIIIFPRDRNGVKIKNVRVATTQETWMMKFYSAMRCLLEKKKIPGTILARMQGLGFAILACFCKLHDLPLTVESGVVVALGKDGNMVIRDGVHIQHTLEKH